MARILVRFSETERYDPLKDSEVVRFIATTEKGSFHTEIPLDGAASVRTRKQAFKEEVVRLIQAGANPCEVRIG